MRQSLGSTTAIMAAIRRTLGTASGFPKGTPGVPTIRARQLRRLPQAVIVLALLTSGCTWRTGTVEHYLGPVFFRYNEPPEANAHVSQVMRIGVWAEAGTQGGLSVGLSQRIAVSPRLFDSGESGAPMAPVRWCMPLSPIPNPAPLRWHFSLLYLRVEGVSEPRFVNRMTYGAEVVVGKEANAFSVGATSRTWVKPPENALSLLRFDSSRPMVTLFWVWLHTPGRDLPLSTILKEGEP